MLVCSCCQVELTNVTWSASLRRSGHYRCKACYNKYQKEWAERNPEKRKATRRKGLKKWYPKLGKAAHVRARLRWKHRVVEAYGSKCACCGEAHWQFLEVDHVTGNGTAHRREIKMNGGQQFYMWLERQGYPKVEFQLLCSNCNQAKHRYGQCPHQLERVL